MGECVRGNRVEAPLGATCCVRCAVCWCPDGGQRSKRGARKEGFFAVFFFTSSHQPPPHQLALARRRFLVPSQKPFRVDLTAPSQEGTIRVGRGYAHCLARAHVDAS